MKEKLDNKDVFKFAIMIILLSLPEVISYYSDNSILPTSFVRVSIFSVFLLLFYCSLKNTSNYQRYLFICYFVMLFTSIFNITPKMPLLTIASIGALIIMGTFLKPMSLTFINKAFAICALIYIPVFIFQIGKANLDIGVLINRGYAWTEIFAYATLTSIWLPFFFSSFLTKKNILLSLVFWLFAFFMSLISMKRQNIIDSAVAFAIIFFIMRKIKDKDMQKRLTIMLVPLVAVLIYALSNGMMSIDAAEVSNAMSERFSETSEDLSSFDRWVETRNYFQNEAGIIDVVFGKGFLSAHSSKISEHYYLHIGWANFVFKGGLLLLFGILFGYKNVFKIFFHPNDYSIELIFCSMYCVFFFFTLFYSNLMGFGIQLPLFFYSLACVNKKHKKITDVSI